MRRLEHRLADDPAGAFEDLVRVYQDRLFAFAFRLTGSRQDAEEVVQDALVRAYRALSGYGSEQVRTLRIKPWLYRITLVRQPAPECQLGQCPGRRRRQSHGGRSAVPPDQCMK
jgi:hypothetical protein